MRISEANILGMFMRIARRFRHERHTATTARVSSFDRLKRTSQLRFEFDSSTILHDATRYEVDPSIPITNVKQQYCSLSRVSACKPCSGQWLWRHSTHDAAGTLCATNNNTTAVRIYLIATPPKCSPPTLSNRSRIVSIRARMLLESWSNWARIAIVIYIGFTELHAVSISAGRKANRGIFRMGLKLLWKKKTDLWL